MDAHDATKTHDCLTPNCTREARSTRGMHAYCTECQRDRAVARGGTAPEPRTARPAGFEARARGLASAGKRLDKAQAEFDKAKANLQAAINGWRDATAALAPQRTSD